MEPHRRPRTCCRDYNLQLVWERQRFPLEEREEVDVKRKVWSAKTLPHDLDKRQLMDERTKRWMTPSNEDFYWSAIDKTTLRDNWSRRASKVVQYFPLWDPSSP